MAFSYKKQTHKSKGKASRIPHPVGASPHSGARKNKLYDALVARENKVRSKTAPLPKKKPKQTGDSLPIEETMKSIGRLNKIQNATKKPKKKAGGKVEYKKHGGKVKYRSIGGKVIDGNDITKMIYD